MRYDAEQARALARRAIGNAGASEAVARSLANATIAAEIHGRPGVGFAHLLDYLDGLRHGRIADNAQPLITFPVPAAIRVDACQGIAQLGFDQAFDALLHRAQTFGIAVFAQTNSYTAGELGYYTRRLAQAGLVALAATNGPRWSPRVAPRAGLWHQSVFLCGAGRARHAASDRPGDQRHRLCQPA